MSKILRFIEFQALDLIFVLALEPKVLKLEGSSFEIRPSIYVLMGCYDEPPKKLPITANMGVKPFIPTCAESEMSYHKGFFNISD